MIINSVIGGGGSASAFTITSSTGSNGTISPLGQIGVVKGTSQVYTITANTGYIVDDVLVDGVSVGAVSTYTFSNVQTDHTISVTFKIQTFTITTTAGSNGSISPTNPSVNYGANQTFTITADSGYEVDTVTVDGVSAGAVTTYTFSSVVANHTISATFKVPLRIHSFTINKATLQTSPTTCVEYESGYSAAQAYTWIMSKLHPSVVSNGTVNYFLDKTDLTKKLDGTAANLDGTDGDVMVSIEPLWWKVTTNDSSSLTIQISDSEISGGVTAHKFNGTVRQYLHLGMFEMSNSAAQSVYSTSLTPWSVITNDTARTTAENRGSTYETMTWLTWSLFQILCVFTSGSTNCHTTIGWDYSQADSLCPVATSAMLTANGYTSSTKSSATDSLMYLFVANPWGNVANLVSGLKISDDITGVINDQYQARGVSVSASIPSTWTTFTTPSVSSYMTAVQGSNYYPFYPLASSGGSSSTYYCNYGLSASGTYCAHVGCGYNSGWVYGLFGGSYRYSESSQNLDIGARLQCLDTTSI